MEWKVSLPFLYVDRQRLTQLFICSTNPHYADVKTWAASFKEYVIYIQELLQTFLQLIDDADILSGWNSEGYDIPYTVNRITQVLGKNELRNLCN